MASMRRIDRTGSAFRRESRPGPTAGAPIPWGIRVALLAMVLAGMALWSTAAYAEGEEASEPLWSADMTVVEYTSVSIGAASADLFSNIGGSGNLQIKSLWSHRPDRDLRLVFADEVPNAADYTLQVGDLSLEFPEGSSGSSNFRWNDVDVDWEDGQRLRVRIVLTTEVVAPQSNTPATGVLTISGTPQVGATLAADTSGIADADGMTNVSYAYRWIRNADHIPDATDASYTLTDDDRGRTITLQVSFIDDQGNSETLTSAATAQVSARPQFLVGNLGVGVTGASGIQRTLDAVRPGVAQAFTTGASASGYALGAVEIQMSNFHDASTTGKQLRVTINGAASEGEPGDAQCTLTNPSSFPALSVISFGAPTGGDVCAPLAAETTYFVVIEWISPTGTDSFAVIPQTYPTKKSAATAEDEGGADGWSIADHSYYLSVSSDTRTWTAYDETASFKIKVKEGTAAAKVNSPATGLPTITGTAQVGQTLTADTSAIEDEDGLESVSYWYQWLADDTDIDGTTASTYTLVLADQGKTIKVKVTFTDDAENQESLTSEATVAVAAKDNTAPTGLPTITGTAQVGETLTADTSAIDDADGLENVSYSYQWLADDTDIDGATASTYTLVLADQGKTIKVKVTFTDDAENQESLTSAATVAVAAKSNAAPTGLPTITGTAKVDQTLTADTSAIDDGDGLTNVAYEYQWIAGSTDINGATGSSYTLTSSEQGKTIKVKVTFTDDAENEETLTSVATATVDATVPTQPLGLTVSTGDQSQEIDVSWQAPSSNGGSDVTGYKVQWKETANSWDTEADVSEATVTGTTYTITDLTGGEEYAVRVIATNIAGDGPASAEAAGTPDEAVSEQITDSENSDPTGLPTIRGTPQVDQTLTTDTSAIDDEDGLTNVSYEYQWTAGGTDIAGATGSTYHLTSSEEGKTIQVKVTFTDDRGNSESLTSEATDAVAPKPVPLTASVSGLPETHSGPGTTFQFTLTFSENIDAGFRRIRDHAFTLSGADITQAPRTHPQADDRNRVWTITVKVDADHTGAVTLTLPVTTDCSSAGAICTFDGRRLSHSTSVSVAEPN